MEFCFKQLEAVMPYVRVEVRDVVVVCEPLWAIGTGIAAEPKKVQKCTLRFATGSPRAPASRERRRCASRGEA